MRSMSANSVAAGMRRVKACPVMLVPICATLGWLTVRSRAAPSIFYTGSWRKRTLSQSTVSDRRSLPQTILLKPPPNDPPVCPLRPAKDLKHQRTLPVFCAGRSLRIVKAWHATHGLTWIISGWLTCPGKALQSTPCRNWSAVAC